MPAMNSAAILTPSGRSMMFATWCRRRPRDHRANADLARRRRPARAESVTATAAEVISTSTPVA